MTKIISHLTPEWINLEIPHTNGAYWYSKELLENVIPQGEYEGANFALIDNKDVIPELQRLLNEIDKD